MFELVNTAHRHVTSMPIHQWEMDNDEIPEGLALPTIFHHDSRPYTGMGSHSGTYDDYIIECKGAPIPMVKIVDSNTLLLVSGLGISVNGETHWSHLSVTFEAEEWVKAKTLQFNVEGTVYEICVFNRIHMLNPLVRVVEVWGGGSKFSIEPADVVGDMEIVTPCERTFKGLFRNGQLTVAE